MIKVVAPLEPDGVVERGSEEAMAYFIATPIRPILLVLHPCRKTRFSVYSTSNVTDVVGGAAYNGISPILVFSTVGAQGMNLHRF